jgi:hypothetical protein
MRLLDRKHNPKSRDVHVRLTEVQYALLKKCAEEEDWTISACARIYMMRQAHGQKKGATK